jgi:hypothetical protein
MKQASRALLFGVFELIRVLRWRLPWTAISWLIRPRFLVLVRDLSQPLPPAQPSAITRQSVLTENESETIFAINQRMTPAEVRRRLADGQVCHLDWVGSRLAHFRWEVTRLTYVPYLGKTFHPRAGQVLGDLVFTAPSCRGRGIDSAAAVTALHRMQAEGLREAIGIIAWWNSVELGVSRRRWGTSVVGAIGYWNLGLGRHYFVEGAVRLDSSTSFCIDT